MKQFQSQLKKKANEISLKASEKRELRERLVAYMEYHPLPNKSAKLVQENKLIASEPFFSIHLNSFFVRNVAGAFVLLLMVGVPLVAERSVPGDVLYPVKVQFNEEVRSTLTRSSYDKVVWETERLERRVSEARLLAKEGKLTPEAEAKVVKAVKEHGEAVQQELETMRDNNADEAVIAEIAYNSALDVQSAILKSGNNSSNTTGMGIAMVLAEGRAVEHTPGPGTVSVELLKARLELETTRSYELMQSITQYVSPEELFDIRRRLEDIQRNIAKVYGEEGEYGEYGEDAYEILTKALSSTQKLIVFMTDIDVQENVDVEELVPVQLTDEEREAEISEVSAYVKSLVARVKNHLASEAKIEIDVREKVELSLPKIVNLQNEAVLANEAGLHDKSLEALKEAKEYLDNVVSMLDLEPLEEIDLENLTASSTADIGEEVGTTTEVVTDEME